MNREVRLAKKLLESKGYKVTENARGDRASVARALVRALDDESIMNALGSVRSIDPALYKKAQELMSSGEYSLSAIAKEISDELVLGESKKMDESVEEHAGWEYYGHTPGKGPWTANQYSKEYNNELYLTIYPPQEVPGEGYQDHWGAEIQGINSGTSIDSYEDGFKSFEQAEAWINSQLEKYDPEGDQNARDERILQDAIDRFDKVLKYIEDEPDYIKDAFKEKAMQILGSLK